MTNIPFDPNEGLYWKPHRASFSSRFRSALRVDPLLAGDKVAIEFALKSSGYDVTLEGARQYLRDWCDTMKPEYMMASTPHDFIFPEGTLSGIDSRRSINPDALVEPFSFVPAISAQPSCLPPEDEAPSVIDEHSDFLRQVLMQVCEERDLPIALKIGAHRGLNPALRLLEMEWSPLPMPVCWHGCVLDFRKFAFWPHFCLETISTRPVSSPPNFGTFICTVAGGIAITLASFMK
jgi:hypothetical protein